MLAEGRRLAVIWSTETRVTLRLATVRERGYPEVPGVLFAKRYRIAEQPELQWITPNGGAGILQFCAFDKTQNHEPLYYGIVRVDRPYDPFLATSQRCEIYCLQGSKLRLLTI